MKDYKKILEGVVNIINTTEKSDIGFANICTYIGENCPELKESEDEKIRKELLNAFQESEDSLYMVLTPHRRESFIAWLEKQGEHTNFLSKIQVGDKVTRNEDGVLVNLSQLNRVAKKDEKQGEQKPQGKSALEAAKEEKIDNANKVKPKFKIGDIIRFKGNETLRGEAETHKIVSYDNELYVFADGTTDLFCEQDMYELVEHKPVDKVEQNPTDEVGNYDHKEVLQTIINEQNPAWSEEDEDILNTIINHFKVDIECTDEDDTVRWLKSLKERVQPQSKQEWSEEDEKCIRLTTDIINSALRAGFCVQLDRDRCVDWFKSLKDRAAWKPSEAQMQVLEFISDYHAFANKNNQDIFKEFLKQLKKLRE